MAARAMVTVIVGGIGRGTAIVIASGTGSRVANEIASGLNGNTGLGNCFLRCLE